MIEFYIKKSLLRESKPMLPIRQKWSSIWSYFLRSNVQDSWSLHQSKATNTYIKIYILTSKAFTILRTLINFSLFFYSLHLFDRKLILINSILPMINYLDWFDLVVVVCSIWRRMVFHTYIRKWSMW